MKTEGAGQSNLEPLSLTSDRAAVAGKDTIAGTGFSYLEPLLCQKQVSVLYCDFGSVFMFLFLP